MFAALRPYQDRIETYTYTDLSKAFLNRAKALFGPQVPYLDCRRFDAEQPLAGQGIPEGNYDLVVAANVLHATRNMRNTLRNAKSALRDKGWLLLNELTAFDVFSHLTFGLLEGWWLSEDLPLRVPGSPALAPEVWREVLLSEGFSWVVSLLPHARDLGPQVLASESDGVAHRRVAVRARAATSPRTTATAPAPAAPATATASSVPVAVPGARAVVSPTPATVSTLPNGAPPAPAVVAPVTATTRASALAAYLTGKAAETLRIPAERIDPGTSFASYGMDSILVLQFTDALREDLGELSSALLFEEDLVDRLGAYLLEHRAPEVDSLTGTRPPDDETAGSPDTVRGPAAASIGSLFTTLARAGDPAQGSALLTAAARLRPAFASVADGREPETLHLADGADGLGLVCLPSLVAPTGAHQYLRFAIALRGLRSVWTAGVPGYGAGDPLPGTLDAAMDLPADFLRRRFAGRRFALVAYSSGGWAAHEVVRRLDASGGAPAALVLLDSPGRADDDVARGMATIAHWLTSRFPQLPVQDEQLTAMARYAELFDGWRPRPVSTPTLFVGAASEGPLFDVLGDRSGPLWRPE